MNRKTIAVSAILAAIVIIAMWHNATPLQNPGFESHGFTHDALRCTGGACAIVQRDNIFSPDGWTVWYVENEPCWPPYVTGQPEARTTTLVIDPGRIHTGSQAMNVFTTWRCHHAGLYQVVSVEPGAYYRASAFAHAWYSQCSTRPHGPPLESDCETPIAWAHDALSIGLGGDNPLSPDIAWSPAYEVYGTYDGALRSPLVRATGVTMTLFLRSITTHPLKHNDMYCDDATLDRVDVTWLPVISR